MVDQIVCSEYPWGGLMCKDCFGICVIGMVLRPVREERDGSRKWSTGKHMLGQATC